MKIELNKTNKGKEILKVGDKVCVGPSDTVFGGVATVSEIFPGISADKEVIHVRLKELPGVVYNWTYLSGQQKDLKRTYGTRIARHAYRL